MFVRYFAIHRWKLQYIPQTILITRLRWIVLVTVKRVTVSTLAALRQSMLTSSPSLSPPLPENIFISFLSSFVKLFHHFGQHWIIICKLVIVNLQFYQMWSVYCPLFLSFCLSFSFLGNTWLNHIILLWGNSGQNNTFGKFRPLKMLHHLENLPDYLITSFINVFLNSFFLDCVLPCIRDQILSQIFNLGQNITFRNSMGSIMPRQALRSSHSHAGGYLTGPLSLSINVSRKKALWHFGSCSLPGSKLSSKLTSWLHRDFRRTDWHLDCWISHN